jgi:hypothetical protein
VKEPWRHIKQLGDSLGRIRETVVARF